MSEDEAELPRKDVEEAFHQLLERIREDPEASRAFLLQQPTGVRQELERMLVDYRLLLDAFAGTGRGLKTGRDVGPYELLVEIGRGGMGSVWEARHRGLNRRVALKLLHPHLTLSPRALDRFRREAMAGARLSHPGIVATYEIGDADGVTYLAMELVPGGFTLGDRIAAWRESLDRGRAHWRELAQIFLDIAVALDHAHQMGVVHRDMKPGNVLIGEDGRPRIADFGLAKLQDELAISRTGEVTGTPFYMSPEQASGRSADVGPQGDVFALGVTLYEALALQRPFEAESAPLVLEKIVREHPQDPRAIRRDVPRDLASIALKALEKSPSKRYASAGLMAEEFRRYLADEPVIARPPGPVGRATRWARRHPVWSAAAGLTTISLTFVLALLVQNLREQDRTTRMLALTGMAVEVLDPRGVASEGAAQELERAIDASMPDLGDRSQEHVQLLVLQGRVRHLIRDPRERESLEQALSLAESSGTFTLSELTMLRYLCGSAQVAAFHLQPARNNLGAALKAALESGPVDAPLAREIATQLVLTLARGNRWSEIDSLAANIGDPRVWMEQRLLNLNRERGDSDPTTIETGLTLARIYSDRQIARGGDNVRALGILEPLVAPTVGRFGPNDPRYFEVRLYYLTAKHRALGIEADTSLEMRSLAEEIEAALGEAHPLTAFATWRRAVLALDSEQYQEALRLSRLGVERMRHAFGDRHLDTYNVRTDVGMALAFLGRLGESETELALLIADMESDPELGKEHDATLIARRALVSTLRWQGEFDEALSVAIENYYRRIRLNGSEHADTRHELATAVGLSTWAGRAGVFDEFFPLLSPARCGSGDPNRRAAELGAAQEAFLQAMGAGRIELARKYLSCAEENAEITEAEAAERFRKAVSTGEPTDLKYKGSMEAAWVRANIAIARGELSLAETLLADCALLDHPRTVFVDATWQLAELLRIRGDVSSARAWLQLGGDERARRIPYDCPRSERFREALAR